MSLIGLGAIASLVGVAGLKLGAWWRAKEKERTATALKMALRHLANAHQQANRFPHESVSWQAWVACAAAWRAASCQPLDARLFDAAVDSEMKAQAVSS